MAMPAVRVASRREGIAIRQQSRNIREPFSLYFTPYFSLTEQY